MIDLLFGMLGCLENERLGQLFEKHSWKEYLLGMGFIHSNSTSYNDGGLYYLQLHMQAANWLGSQLHEPAM